MRSYPSARSVVLCLVLLQAALLAGMGGATWASDAPILTADNGATTPSEALVDVTPDTLNKKSRGRWVTARIYPPEGFDADDIATTSAAIVAWIEGGTTPTTHNYYQPYDPRFRPRICDGDDDGDDPDDPFDVDDDDETSPHLKVKFDRQLLIANLFPDPEAVAADDDDDPDDSHPEVGIVIECELTSGALFSGTDWINVVHFIDSQPQREVVVDEGDSGALGVRLVDGVTATFRWFWNGYPVPGATGSAVGTNSAQPEYSGTLTCAVTSADVTVKTDPSELIVIPAPVAPAITQQPASVTVSAGGSAAISVSASGTPPLSYQWYLNGTTALSAAYGGQTPEVSASGIPRSANGARLHCVVGNAAGQAGSNTATLTVTP